MKNLLVLVILSVACAFLLASCSGAAKKAEPFDAEKLFKKANENLADKHMVVARQDLERIVRMDTTYEYAPLAQLRLGDSYMMDKDFELAIEEYGRFLDIYPRHKYAAYAQYQVGLAYFSMIKGPDKGWGAAMNALDAFMFLQERYPRNPYREDVDVKIAECRRIIAEHERLVGEFYYKRGACIGAVDRLEGLVRDFPEYADEPSVLMQLSVCYWKIERPEDSDASLERLRALYPDSKYVGKALKQIKKLEKK